jgi:hypothetical protein
MQGQGGQPGPDLLGALLKDMQMISNQMRAALSGRPDQPHSGPTFAPVRRQYRRRRREDQ